MTLSITPKLLLFNALNFKTYSDNRDENKLFCNLSKNMLILEETTDTKTIFPPKIFAINVFTTTLTFDVSLCLSLSISWLFSLDFDSFELG